MKKVIKQKPQENLMANTMAYGINMSQKKLLAGQNLRLFHKHDIVGI
jgi:hypothetical protein